ncbi:replication-associated protein [Tomato associated geminivirus 2]|nr:replication-associated protein [Tomato associated geminivirus 2]
MPRQPSSFKIQGKSFFLTYPKCPLIPIFIIDYFYQLLRDHTVTYVRACTENHQDGEPHIHCLVQTEKRFQTKNQRFFDISDPNGSRIYHPNIQVPRRDADVADYISKGGTFEERGILRASRRSPKKNRDSIWTTILNESTSKSDFLTRVFAEQPFTYANNYRNLEYMADKHWPTEPESYTPTWTTFVGIPQSLQNWADQNIFCEPERRPDRPTTAIIEGPTRCGKTAWARSLGKHNYYCGGVDWSNYDSNAIYNVFDDIPYQYLPCKKEILGAQKDFTVNEKYKKKCRIKGGIPSIVLCNSDQSYEKAIANSDINEWSQPNVEYFFINENLY